MFEVRNAIRTSTNKEFFSNGCKYETRFHVTSEASLVKFVVFQR